MTRKIHTNTLWICNGGMDLETKLHVMVVVANFSTTQLGDTVD